MFANVFTKTILDRWKGMAIGAGVLGLLLLLGMSAYRDIDLAVYTGLPEVFRSLVNIPEDADIASLAYGAIYGSYGALTLAALALSMGSRSIAGEERDGTIALLLGNPKSRTHVLVAKTASMVTLTALAALVLWGAGYVAPEVLDVDVSGMQIGAFMLHMLAASLFVGFLATAIGAWTGSRAMATGVTAGVLMLSFFAVGLLPLVEGLEDGARLFPWYYFNGSEPLLNGIHWGHLGVMAAGCVVFAVVAVVGLNRRDLRGQTVGVSLVDRLRANPMTHAAVERLAGSARVSRIWVKTFSEHQGLLLVTAAVMFLLMGVMLGPMYNLIDDALAGFTDTFPEALMALFGGSADLGTPEGWYQVEVFGMMAPIAVMIVTITIGARALAGEEERRTMGLLLANPVSRGRIVAEKSLAMALYALAVGFSIFAGVAAGSLLGGLGMNMANIAATAVLVTLVGLVFGALALALSAATGRARIAIFGAIGVALALHVVNALLPLNDSLSAYAKASPFYYYLSSDPLNNGMPWGHGAVLTGLAVGLFALSVWLFGRRDLHERG